MAGTRERTAATSPRSISAKPRPLFSAHVEQDLAPGPDDEAVAVGVAAVLMMAALGGGDDEHARLDRPGAHQDVPVRLAGRDGEGGGDGEQFAPASVSAVEEGGKRRS
jgi:hypothetical protein